MPTNGQIKAFFKFRFVERLALTMIFTAMIIDLVMIFVRQANINWAEYVAAFLLVLALMLAGLTYRYIERSERIASTFICAGLLILFSSVISLFNYLLLPLVRAPIDEQLAVIDAFFGYHWPTVMQWAADHPIINLILKISYMTTMFQVTLLIVLLGLTGKLKQLDVLLLSVIISATTAICFWAIFPSMGTTTIHELSPELWATVAPVVDYAYAQDLRHIAVHGPDRIGPYEVRGLIAFPSYHASLAFIAMFASRPFKYLFPFMVVLNIIIIPSVFVHGGHHFVDPFAGFVLFAMSWYIARYYILADRYSDSSAQKVNAS